MIDYKDYKKPEGSKFLKLKEELLQEGDEIELKCLSGKMVPASETQFGCSQLELTVEYKGQEKILNCDAPDEKNEWQGSQVYRGIKDNDIQSGDSFFIGHGGRMNNKYRTTIYGVAKNELREKPKDWEEPEPDKLDLDTAPQSEGDIDMKSIPF